MTDLLPPTSNPTLRDHLTPLPNEEELILRQKKFTRYRRVTAAWMGFGMGLISVACAYSVNQWSLPGLPLYQPPPGMPWLALGGGVVCALVGLVTAWSQTSVIGILWGSLAGTLVFDSFALINSLPDKVPPAWIAGILFLILLPIAAMVSLVIGVFRWALNRHQSSWQDHGSVLVLVGIPLLLFLASLGLGYSARYPQDGLQVVRRMDNLIQSGQRSAAGDLPPVLINDSIDNFQAHATGTYTLEWSKDPTNRYAIPRPAGSGGRESIVIARFSSGYLFICLYATPESEPECVSR